jgi:hypothetical protein
MIGHVRPEEMSGWRCLVGLSSLNGAIIFEIDRRANW